MRLGQLSRKLDLKPTEIREFIRKNFNVEIDLDLNTRIEDFHASALTEKFEKKQELVVKKTATPLAENITTDEPLKSDLRVESHQIEDIPPKVHVPIEIENYHESPKHDLPIVESADAFIPRPVDPDAELIKAPKIKLDGLKVLGKIDLPQPKVKEEPVADSSETVTTESQSEVAETTGSGTTRKHAPKSFKERRLNLEREQLENDEEYSIYKDKNGIYHFSQTQKENRKNSLERIKRNRQEEERKKKKINHYKQIVETEKKSDSNSKKSKKNTQKESRKQDEKPVRKGVWGKFLNWLNG